MCICKNIRNPLKDFAAHMKIPVKKVEMNCPKLAPNQ